MLTGPSRGRCSGRNLQREEPWTSSSGCRRGPRAHAQRAVAAARTARDRDEARAALGGRAPDGLPLEPPLEDGRVTAAVGRTGSPSSRCATARPVSAPRESSGASTCGPGSASISATCLPRPAQASTKNVTEPAEQAVFRKSGTGFSPPPAQLEQERQEPEMIRAACGDDGCHAVRASRTWERQQRCSLSPSSPQAWRRYERRASTDSSHCQE
jgi:hypothetical protein